MCLFLRVIYTLLFCSLVVSSLSAQQDTTAELRLQNIVIKPPRTIDLEIALKNCSAPLSNNTWRLWANGTFFLNISNCPLNGSVLELDSSGLRAEQSRSPLTDGRSGYEAKMLVQAERQRLVMAILGSDSLENTQRVLPDSTIVLGRFRLTLADTIESPEKIRVSWALPLRRFQANAFKVERQSRFQGKDFQKNDNVEMTTRFLAEKPVVELPPEVFANGLQVEYAGDKRVRLRWQTREERLGRRTNAGFVLLRQEVSRGTATFDTVTTFLRSASLRLRGAPNGADYEHHDSVPKRGAIYAYRLGFLDATVRLVQQFRAVFPSDTVAIAIPNAILSSAEVNPNPFAETALVRYMLLDRALVTAHLYDAAGRLIDAVFTGLERPRGTHTFSLDAARLPNQVAYFLVLRASALNDEAVERSQATLKIQLSR